MLYFPAVQFTHVQDADGLNLPGEQDLQYMDPLDEYLPGEQLVHVRAEILAPVCEPALHSKQLPVSGCGAYRPAVQLRHADALNTKRPAVHVSHFVRSRLLNSPVGQKMQS